MSRRRKRILVLSPTPTHPQNYGNRKRIYSYCNVLKNMGHKIHFLFFPSECEWCDEYSELHVREMMDCWDGFNIIPPALGRALHSHPKGEVHTIDEWWDPVLEHYLRWLLDKISFDIFFVNYCYLSKAFEFAHPLTLKILDSHDKFSNRLQLLQKNGIKPEFFYTIEIEEKIALDRADLILAIKEQEKEFFSTLSDTPVITLPHFEERKIVDYSPSSEREFLKLGFIGANNSINVHNIRNFINEALPVFRRYYAPIKIFLAGMISRSFIDIKHSHLEVLGEIDNVDEFYASIDAAIVPMEFSTGLKIKAAEAIAAGVPVIGTAHAMEGISSNELYHSLGSLEELVQYCLELSFDRSLLISMRQKSLRLCSDLKDEYSGKLSQIIETNNEGSFLVITDNLNKTFDLCKNQPMDGVAKIGECIYLIVGGEVPADNRNNILHINESNKFEGGLGGVVRRQSVCAVIKHYSGVKNGSLDCVVDLPSLTIADTNQKNHLDSDVIITNDLDHYWQLKQGDRDISGYYMPDIKSKHRSSSVHPGDPISLLFILDPQYDNSGVEELFEFIDSRTVQSLSCFVFGDINASAFISEEGLADQKIHIAVDLCPYLRSTDHLKYALAEAGCAMLRHADSDALQMFGQHGKTFLAFSSVADLIQKLLFLINDPVFVRCLADDLRRAYNQWNPQYANSEIINNFLIDKRKMLWRELLLF